MEAPLSAARRVAESHSRRSDTHTVGGSPARCSCRRDVDSRGDSIRRRVRTQAAIGSSSSAMASTGGSRGLRSRLRPRVASRMRDGTQNAASQPRVRDLCC